MKQFLLLLCVLLGALKLSAQTPIAQFSADRLTVCVGEPIQFTNLSDVYGQSVLSTNWNFGEGGVSTASNPTYTYTNAGEFTVLLTVITAGGTDVESKTKYIKVNPLPTTNFTVSGDLCSLPFYGTINNTSVSGSDYSYTWDYGNGQTYNTQNPPQMVVQTQGTYNVQLNVTNTLTGCTNSKTKQLALANFVAGIDAPTTACYLYPVQINDGSTSGANNWLWTTSNGQSSNLQNPTFNFPNPGTYTINLSAQNTLLGCSKSTSKTITVQSAPSPNFSVSPSSGCAPITVNITNLSSSGTFNWDFGNGNTYTGQNPPAQTYTTNGNFVISLSMSASSGCVGSSTFKDTVHIASPTPYIKADYRGGCSPLTVQFIDSSYSSNPSGDPLVYWEWNLGDGTTYIGQTPPAHTYTIGKYDITLKVRTQSGCETTKLFKDFIKVGQIDAVDFSANPTVGCARKNYQFTNLSNVSSASNPSDVTYDWDFGDGGSSNSKDPVYTFPVDSGYFDIKLVVDFNGCKDSLIKPNMIYIKTPISKFKIDTLICNPSAFPLRVPVKDQSTLGKGNDDVTMIWRWDNSSNYTLNSTDVFDSNKGDTAYYFSTYGHYTVKQVVINNTIGCSDSTTQNVVISKLQPSFVLSADTICLGQTLTITSTSQLTDGNGFFSFNLGNGVVKNANPLTYTYANSGTYNITLKAFNDAGCINTIAYNNFKVLPRPTASFTSSINTLTCLPAITTLTNTSTNTSNVKSYHWTLPDGSTTTTTNVNDQVVFQYLNAGTFVTYLIAEDDFGCTSASSATQTVQISNPFILTDIDSVYCNNAPIQVTNTSVGNGNLKYSWYIDNQFFTSDTNLRTVFNESQLITDSTANHEVKLVVEDGYGCKDSLVQPIHIPLPHVVFDIIYSGASVNSLGQYVCPPVFTSFKDSSYSYGNITSWNWSFGDGKSSAFQSPNNTYPFPGTYTLTFEIQDEHGCKQDTSLIDYLKILGPTVNPSWTDLMTSCGNEFQFEATGHNPDNTLTWDLGDGTKMTDNLLFQYSYNPGTFHPIATVKDSLNCSVIYPLNEITITPVSFSSNAGPDQVVCIDQTNLDATPVLNNTFTGKWKVVQGTAIIADNNDPKSLVTNLGSSENLLVWEVNDGCKSAFDTVSILNGYQAINAGPDQNICSYSSVLDADPPRIGTGTWSSSISTVTFDNVNDPTSGVDNLIVGDNPIIWTINSICGQKKDTLIIKAVTPPTTSNAGLDDTVCIDSYTMKGNVPTVGNGVWRIISGNATIVDSLDPHSDLTNIGLGTTILEWEIATNCTSNSDQVSITRVAIPTVANVMNDTVFCDNTLAIYADTNLIGNGVWSIVKGTSCSILNANYASTMVNNLPFGETILKWTVSNYCASTFDEVSIIREQNPSNANPGNDILSCFDTLVVVAQQPTYGEGIWSFIYGNADFVGATDSNVVQLKNIDVGANRLLWTISNTCGSDTASILIQRASPPTTAITELDKTICAYENIISANQPQYENGLWTTIEGTGIVTFEDSAKTEVTNLSLGYNRFTWAISNSCFSSIDTLSIFVDPPPTKAEVGPKQKFCGGEAILSGNIPIIGEGYWSFKEGSGHIHTLTDPTSGVDSLAPGKNILVWTIDNTCNNSSAELILWNTGKCPDEDSIRNSLVYFVPNSFTPNNGDDLNNLFMPVFTSGYEPLDYSFFVFDRWGTVIFESHDATYGWNGRLANGELMQMGVYPWKIMFTDILNQKERVLNGHVLLIR